MIMMHLVDVLVHKGEVVERMMTKVETKVLNKCAEQDLSDAHQSIWNTIRGHVEVSFKTRPDDEVVSSWSKYEHV